MTPNELESLPISESLKTCARRLLEHEFEAPEVSIANHPTFIAPGRLAAVLILLYERLGSIRVLLTTRSKHLRSHPGQVALPGGKSDLSDGTPQNTALREANEEVELPLNSPHIHILRTIPPFPSLYKLIVTPVVALLSDLKVLDELVPHEAEVDDIFDHPLEAFLDPAVMFNEPNLSPRDSPKWIYPEEFHDYSDGPFMEKFTYRNHRFRSTSTPVKGLTSSMMILTAEAALGRKATFQQFPLGHLPFADAIKAILDEEAAKAEAQREEDAADTTDPEVIEA